jgi:hypothetical protein
MVDRGTVVKYRASVTLDPQKVTNLNTPSQVIHAFLVSLQSNLANGGLLLIDYKISQASGPYQYLCSFTLQTTHDFRSKQAIVTQVNNQITQVTGTAPRWSADPPVGNTGCSPLSGAGGSWSDWFHNALFGTLTACQKNAGTAQETAALIQAGANPTDAASQAQLDWTQTLTINGADPSQTPSLAIPALGIGTVMIGILLLAVFVFARGSRL